MSTIKSLLDNSKEDSLYIYLPSSDICRRFLKDAENEGFTDSFGRSPTNLRTDCVIIVRRDMTLSNTGSIGHIACNDASTRINYEEILKQKIEFDFFAIISTVGKKNYRELTGDLKYLGLTYQTISGNWQKLAEGTQTLCVQNVYYSWEQFSDIMLTLSNVPPCKSLLLARKNYDNYDITYYRNGSRISRYTALDPVNALTKLVCPINFDKEIKNHNAASSRTFAGGYARVACIKNLHEKYDKLIEGNIKTNQHAEICSSGILHYMKTAKSWAIISLPKENLPRLKQMIRDKGYGFIQFISLWDRNDNVAEEHAIFTPNCTDKDAHLFKEAFTGSRLIFAETDNPIGNIPLKLLEVSEIEQPTPAVFRGFTKRRVY